MLKRFFLLAVSSSCLMACELFATLDPKGEQFEKQVINCAKDTLFDIENKSITASAHFHIEGELTHNARLLWSFEPLDTLVITSKLPASVTEIVLPKGKVDVSDSGDYYSKRLYMRYVPENDSTSGNLVVKIKI